MEVKLYPNVVELIKNTSKNKKFNKELEKEINDKEISKFLFALRCKSGLTQLQLSKRTGFTIEKIRKIERSYNDNLTIKDISNYCNALNSKFEIKLTL